MKFFKENSKEVLIIIVSFIVYIFLSKYYRPKIYSNANSNEYLVFLIGVLPNFIGAIITFLTFTIMYKVIGKEHNFKTKSLVATLILVIFMEFKRQIFEGIKFDFFDILASLIAVSICYYLYSNKL